MNDFLEELWVVISYSTKTQLAIAFGLISFVSFLLLGEVMVSHIEFHGALAPMADVVKEKLMHRYDKAAWAALGGFVLLAFKMYRKDRRRLLGV
jgi:hypothetical protein